MSEQAFRALVRTLQNAASGELAAGFAYRGHWRSVRDAAERAHIHQIEDEEWHHRSLVIDLLRDLGARPRPLREAVFWVIGRTLGFACHISGWFFPMYGAGRLERRNIVEYEDCARYALACGHPEMLDCLLSMAEVEWEHEHYFRERVTGHRWTRVFRLWPEAPPKESIRQGFERAA